MVGLDLGQLQQVGDDAGEAIRLPEQRLEKLPRIGSIVRGAEEQGFGIGADDAHRRAKLMRDVGHEIAADRFEAA